MKFLFEFKTFMYRNALDKKNMNFFLTLDFNGF